ncbi:NF038122 family metalloprotease [Phenylobacterium sp.]|jgi:Ca2+-binding RTX toxin-like protein|uniref:NF038122 family metalloprotease n=1 Tax=Phenylobacterium sp. TaxID=1871053 RepID=UPI002E338B04|nr:NF038122 family metalloprotease [Phenylobacterium sp.]HEX3363722.1 NF038122 family metalloprotease [Phenylobacterium sp.]
MPLSGETIALAGSGIVFNNTYDAGVTDQVRASIVTAENYLQAHFTDNVTLNLQFDFDPSTSSNAATNLFGVHFFTYDQVVAAMTAHATTADDRLAVASLPTTDPSNGVGFEMPSGEAQALGLLPPSGIVDDTVIISSNQPWTFGSDLVGVVEHEISEGGFGRFQSLSFGANGKFTPFDLFRFDSTGARDLTGGSDNLFSFFGVDGSHLSGILHNSIGASGVNDGQDLGDWDLTFEDAFGAGGGGYATSISAVDLQVLDVLGFTPSGAPPGSGPDDFANSFTDTTHPFGQLTVGAPLTAMLQSIGDHDWFKVQLNAGTDYVINLTGQDGQGGTLDDPILTLHDATGAQIAQNDDADFTTFDSRLVVHPAASGTFYVEAASLGDVTSGSYTLSVQAGVTVSTPGDDVMVAPAGGGTLMAGAGNDTITADPALTAQTYLRGEDGDDVINGGGGFDDINGNMGNDTIHGNAGDDWVVGGKGDDSQTGDAGNDIVWGNLGNDTLIGGSGNDQVRGGQGDDSLQGGSGNDFISGDRGNDTESGGPGADMFHDSQDAGIDRVLDFHYAEGDRVQLDPGTTYTASQVGADTVVDMGGGNQMILVGVTLSSLPSDWIFEG